MRWRRFSPGESQQTAEKRGLTATRQDRKSPTELASRAGGWPRLRPSSVARNLLRTQQNAVTTPPRNSRCPLRGRDQFLPHVWLDRPPRRPRLRLAALRRPRACQHLGLRCRRRLALHRVHLHRPVVAPPGGLRMRRPMSPKWQDGRIGSRVAEPRNRVLGLLLRAGGRARCRFPRRMSSATTTEPNDRPQRLGPTTETNDRDQRPRPTTETNDRNQRPKPTTETNDRNRRPKPTTETDDRNQRPRPTTETNDRDE
jgi:hypothetical protein